MPTDGAARKRAWRFRVVRMVARLTGRPVPMRFHADPSCGGHPPWSLGGRLRDCPDAAWDFPGDA